MHDCTISWRSLGVIAKSSSALQTLPSDIWVTIVASRCVDGSMMAGDCDRLDSLTDGAASPEQLTSLIWWPTTRSGT